jgi:hypothetical protein
VHEEILVRTRNFFLLFIILILLLSGFTCYFFFFRPKATIVAKDLSSSYFIKNNDFQKKAKGQVSIRTHSSVSAANEIVEIEKRPTYYAEVYSLNNLIKPFQLIPEQYCILADIHGLVYEARMKYELCIAKVEQVSSKEYIITIPQYNEGGKSLQGLFHRLVINQLGHEVDNAITEKGTIALATMQNQWGAFPQVFRVVYNSERDMYEINYAINPFALNGAFRFEGSSTLPANHLDRYEIFRSIFPKTTTITKPTGSGR